MSIGMPEGMEVAIRCVGDVADVGEIEPSDVEDVANVAE